MKRNFALFIFCYQHSLSAWSAASIKQIAHAANKHLASSTRKSIKTNDNQSKLMMIKENQWQSVNQIARAANKHLAFSARFQQPFISENQ